MWCSKRGEYFLLYFNRLSDSSDDKKVQELVLGKGAINLDLMLFLEVISKCFGNRAAYSQQGNLLKSPTVLNHCEL